MAMIFLNCVNCPAIFGVWDDVGNNDEAAPSVWGGGDRIFAKDKGREMLQVLRFIFSTVIGGKGIMFNTSLLGIIVKLIII